MKQQHFRMRKANVQFTAQLCEKMSYRIRNCEKPLNRAICFKKRMRTGNGTDENMNPRISQRDGSSKVVYCSSQETLVVKMTEALNRS